MQLLTLLPAAWQSHSLYSLVLIRSATDWLMNRPKPSSLSFIATLFNYQSVVKKLKTSSLRATSHGANYCHLQVRRSLYKTRPLHDIFPEPTTPSQSAVRRASGVQRKCIIVLICSYYCHGRRCRRRGQLQRNPPATEAHSVIVCGRGRS